MNEDRCTCPQPSTCSYCSRMYPCRCEHCPHRDVRPVTGPDGDNPIRDKQIRELFDDPDTTPAIRWECQIGLGDPRLKQRANKTKARKADARSRSAAAYNARHTGKEGL